jgi:hypothetical protein
MATSQHTWSEKTLHHFPPLRLSTATPGKQAYPLNLPDESPFLVCNSALQMGLYFPGSGPNPLIWRHLGNSMDHVVSVAGPFIAARGRVSLVGVQRLLQLELV